LSGSDLSWRQRQVSSRPGRVAGIKQQGFFQLTNDDVTKYIMEQVKEMKSNSSTTVVCSENPIVEISSWLARMHIIRPKYYSVN
jgi:hypothetical protein